LKIETVTARLEHNASTNYATTCAQVLRTAFNKFKMAIQLPTLLSDDGADTVQHYSDFD
jgi:hypothetical protein